MINSPLAPMTPQPSTLKIVFGLQSVTTKPPPLTTLGLFLTIRVVREGEQKILLTIGRRSDDLLIALSCSFASCLEVIKLLLSRKQRNLTKFEKMTGVCWEQLEESPFWAWRMHGPKARKLVKLGNGFFFTQVELLMYSEWLCVEIDGLKERICALFEISIFEIDCLKVPNYLVSK